MRQHLGANVALIWAPAAAGPGQSSDATTHGNLDDDGDTVDSVVHILQNGL